MADRHNIVVAIGGGFSEGVHPDQDVFLLAAPGLPDQPRVCFLPTASGDSSSYIERFYAAFDPLTVHTTHIELFRRSSHDIDAVLTEQDIIYVGGGNTANLLALWRLHGLVKPLADAYRRGVVLAGISAGAACWFESCLSDSFGPLQPLRDGLGIIPGSFCPHFDSEPEREALYQDAVSSGKLGPGLGLPDDTAVAFIDGVPQRIHRSRPDTYATLVDENTSAPARLAEGWT